MSTSISQQRSQYSSYIDSRVTACDGQGESRFEAEMRRNSHRIQGEARVNCIIELFIELQARPPSIILCRAGDLPVTILTKYYLTIVRAPDTGSDVMIWRVPPAEVWSRICPPFLLLSPFP